MKAIVLFLALIFSVSIATAQEVVMKVRMKNGTELRINTDSVRLMSATTTVPRPQFWMMHFSVPYGFYGIRDEYSYDSTLMDSIRFIRMPNVMTLKLKNNSSFGVGSINMSDSFTDMDTIRFGLYTLNTSVSRIARIDEEPYGQHISTAWHDSTIYAIQPTKKYLLNSEYHVVRDSLFDKVNTNINIEVNDAGNRLAYSLPINGPFEWGHLTELNLTTGIVQVLTNDSMVTASRYMPNSNDIVYYTMGSYHYPSMPNPADAGYYYLDRSTGDTTLLLRHFPYTAEQEVVNGFDISSDGKKLLFSKVGIQKKILLMEFDLDTKRVDTLDVEFEGKYWSGLWTQYNSDDTRILYSLTNMIQAATLSGGVSEVGIIDRATLTKQILDVAPHNMRPFCTPYPRWSPDNAAICYGSAMIPFFVLDTIDPFYLYVKKL